MSIMWMSSRWRSRRAMAATSEGRFAGSRSHTVSSAPSASSSRHSWVPTLPRPCTATRTFRTAKENQRSVVVSVVEGESYRPEDCIAIGFACLFSNSVLMGLPITERAYGPDNLVGNYAIIAFHSPFCYGVGITAMEIVRNRGNGGGRMARAVLTAMFRNTLILAILLGFVVNLTGLPLPGTVEDALALIIRAALPTALFALGGVLVQYRPEGDLRAILMVCVLALLVHPAITWTLGRSLSVPPDLFRSGVLTSAMAPGVNAYIFANIYGRAKRVAASSVLIATGASLFTVWLWLYVLG